MFGGTKNFLNFIYTKIQKCQDTLKIYGQRSIQHCKLNVKKIENLNSILEPKFTTAQCAPKSLKIFSTPKLKSIKLFCNCGILQCNPIFTMLLQQDCKALSLNYMLQKRTMVSCGICAAPPPKKPPCHPCPEKKKKTLCPMLEKKEGLCFRVEMPCCKKSCRYHRRFCCSKTRPYDSSRQRTPKPAFSECMYIRLKVNPECNCHLPRSPCLHDARVFEIHEPPEGCKNAAK